MALRFNHIFAALMVAAAGATLLPARATDTLRAPIVLLFAPVSAPVTQGASWLGERIQPGKKMFDPTVPQGNTGLAAENEALRVQLASMSAQLESLKKINTDREAYGPLRERSVPARIAAGDSSGTQDMLQIMAPAGVTLAERMPVICSEGLVGRVSGTARGAARVRLTTDRDSRFQCRFVRYSRDATGALRYQELNAPVVLVSGMGNGVMRVTNIPTRKIEEFALQPGDWLVLDDPELNPTYSQLQGYRVGKISEILKSRTNPLMSDLAVEPPADFRRLMEVMVVNR